MRKLKKFIVLLLTCVILSNSVCCCYVQAKEPGIISVVAGAVSSAIAGGGSAVLGELLPVVVVIACMVLVAYGIELYFDSENGKKNTAYMTELVLKFCNDTGTNINEWCKGIVEGTTINTSGVLTLSSNANSKLNEFIGYLENENLIVDNFKAPGHYLGNTKLSIINDLKFQTHAQNYTWVYDAFSFSDNIYGVYDSVNDVLVMFVQSTSQFTATRYKKDFSVLRTNNVGTLSSKAPNTRYNVISDFSSYAWNIDAYIDGENNLCVIDDIFFNTTSAVADWIANNVDGKVIDDVGSIGNALVGAGAIAGIDAISGAITLDPAIIDDLAVPQDITIPIPDYIDILSDAIDEAPSVPIEGVDIPIPKVKPKIKAKDEPAPDNPFPDNPIDPEPIAPYMFDLTNIFPFCIPFDLVYLVKTLKATPTAPVIDWRIHVPNVVDYTLHIDLSNWDSVARVFRTCEDVLFILGLILMSRRLIRG